MRVQGLNSGVVSSPEELPGVYVEKLINVMVEARIDSGALLRDLGFTAARTDWRETSVSYRKYLAVVDRLLASGAVPGLGTRIGRRFTVSDYGILGYAMLSSRDLRQAFDLLLNYESLLGAESTLHERYGIERNCVVFTIECHLPPGRLRDFELEVNVAQHSRLWDVFDQIEGKRFMRVNFSCPEPAHSALIRTELDCPVYFGQPETQLVYAATWLDVPFRGSNPLAAEICREQCRILFSQLQEGGGLAAQVKTFILRSPGDTPSVERMAERLNLSARTLRRRLATEGHSYSDLVNEVRMSLAGQYLRETKLPLKEISYLVGYSEVANFQRAFKKGNGQTPLEYRRAAA